METIKNYLDSMFAKYPNTATVLKAKEELWQMMEDKYTELIEEGKTENEAVGTVISEFGNLSELADELGLEEEVNQVAVIEEEEKKDENRRVLTADEVRAYLADIKNGATKLAAGIGCCILTVVGPILADILLVGPWEDAVGMLTFFTLLTLGILLIVFGARKIRTWRFARAKNVAVNMEATKYLVEENRSFAQTHTTKNVLGILCCALCWLPVAVVGSIPALHNIEDLFAITLFCLVAVGVYLLVSSNLPYKSIRMLLAKNGANTIAANMEVSAPQEKEYIHPVIGGILSVYWPTVVCAYLILSFLSFAWGITWILWPIAVVVFVLMDRLLRKHQ